MKNKNFKISKNAIFLLIIASIFAFSGCEQKRELIVATCGVYKPHSYVKDNQLVGIDIEIIQQIASRMNAKLLLLSGNTDSLLQDVKEGYVDAAICALSANEDNEKIVDFSKIYHDDYIDILVNADSFSGKLLLGSKNEEELIENMKELSESRIGATFGNLSQKMAKDRVLAYFEDSNLVEFRQSKGALKSLFNNDIDLLVLDKHTNEYEKSYTNLKKITSPIFKERFAIAIQKGNDELLTQINEILDALMADGTLEAINEKYNLL